MQRELRQLSDVIDCGLRIKAQKTGVFYELIEHKVTKPWSHSLFREAVCGSVYYQHDMRVMQLPTYDLRSHAFASMQSVCETYATSYYWLIHKESWLRWRSHTHTSLYFFLTCISVVMHAVTSKKLKHKFIKTLRWRFEAAVEVLAIKSN